MKLNSLLIAAILVAVAPAAASADDLTASNKKLVTDFMTLGFAQHHIREAFMRYVAPGYIQHSPVVATDGRDAAIAVLAAAVDKNPGYKYEIRHVIADGNMVVVHAWAQFPGSRPRALVDILRVENGMVAEHWDIAQEIPEKSINPHAFF